MPSESNKLAVLNKMEGDLRLLLSINVCAACFIAAFLIGVIYRIQTEHVDWPRVLIITNSFSLLFNVWFARCTYRRLRSVRNLRSSYCKLLNAETDLAIECEADQVRAALAEMDKL